MKKDHFLLAGFIVLKFVLQYLLINPIYELHRDEYLHLDQARHLAWGYLSVPPLTSWISCLIMFLGNSVFWVKFFPALFGALTILVVWKIIETLNGGLFAKILGALAVLFSVIMRMNILYQPNSFDILCWSFLYYTLIRYSKTENNKWLWIAAITFAFGFLNKYNIVFLVVGLLPALLLTVQRKIFLNKWLYAAAGISLLLILPNLIWQYQNGFPFLHHLDELQRTQLVNVKRTDFLLDQLKFFIGSIFVILAALISFFAYPPFKKYRWVLWSFFIILVLFTYLKAKNYYAIGLYPTLLAFGAVYLEQVLKSGWKQYLKPVVLIIPVFLFIPFIKLVFPVMPPASIEQNPQGFKKLGLLRWEDGKDHELPQDFADMLGWKELAEKVDNTYSGIPSQENTLVLCDNYGQAGAINYYSRNPHIQAVSMNADYINWFPLDRKIDNVILVKDIYDTDRNRLKEKPFFESVSFEDSISNNFAREKGTSIYLLQKAQVDVNSLLKNEIRDRKKGSDHK